MKEQQAVLDWYEVHRRDLPWRHRDASGWAVLVSEIMLQQTPVARVLPVYRDWLARWPTPAALAAEPAGEAVRQWGRLGYPRRALRLHETARILTERHGGQVPACHQELLALPGVGGYTAAAVASFAFGQRHAVLDTNVRRVLARLKAGAEFAGPSVSVAEARLAESLLPVEPAVAARWSVAVMELGALVCTAAGPRCTECPVAASCSWLRAGRPQATVRPSGQRYAGTDRQCRGRLLAVLREARRPVSGDQLASAWPDPVRRARALAGLTADGLVEVTADGAFWLPGLPAGAGTPRHRRTSRPSDPEPGDPQPGDPQPGDPQPGDPEPGDPQHGDPQPGDPQPGDPQPGDPQHKDPQHGDPEPGDPPPGIHRRTK